MRNNGSSEHHQNNNLKVVIAFGNFIGKDNSFSDIHKKDQVLEFLNTKFKSYDEDSDKRWITTWNNYLNRLKMIKLSNDNKIISNNNEFYYNQLINIIYNPEFKIKLEMIHWKFLDIFYHLMNFIALVLRI
jgi:hypothetical protein